MNDTGCDDWKKCNFFGALGYPVLGECRLLLYQVLMQPYKVDSQKIPRLTLLNRKLKHNQLSTVLW